MQKKNSQVLKESGRISIFIMAMFPQSKKKERKKSHFLSPILSVNRCVMTPQHIVWWSVMTKHSQNNFKEDNLSSSLQQNLLLSV